MSTAAARDLLEVLVAPYRAYAVYAFAQLGVADHLPDPEADPDADPDPVGLTDLAARTGADPAGLERLLRLLARLDVVAGDAATGYRSARLGRLLRRDNPHSMTDLAILYGDQAYPTFGHIVHSVQTGEPAFERWAGQSWPEYYRSHPEAGQVFDGAMRAGSAFFGAVPQAHDFSTHEHVVDVGGGNGTLLETVLRAHPHLRGTLAEAPRLVEGARARLDASDIGTRCEVVATDFFAAVPPKHDLYLLSRILHDWDDQDCGRVLRSCRDAMAPGTPLLVIERVVPPAGTPGSLALEWDLHMLVNTGGRERTLDEYTRLLDAGGFALERTTTLPLELSLLVARAD